MESIILETIQSCEWYSSKFLIVSQNVYSPLLYYSYFGAMIPSIFIAFFVFVKGSKKLANKLLLLTVLSFSFWIFFALITWATEFPQMTMFAWSLLIILEPLVYFFAFYFVYSIIFEKDFSTLQKIIFSFPLLITFIFTPTKHGLTGYDLTNCDRAAVEGIVATYGYAIEFLYIILILGFFVYFLKKNKDQIQRKRAILITTGAVLFLVSFSLGNILEVFTENWLIGQYGLFGAPVFVGILAYSMVKYKTFNTKIIGAQALVAGLWILVLSMLFVRTIQNMRHVIILTLILVIIFGYYLVKSVKQIELQGILLKQANDRLKELDKQKSEFVSLASHQLRSPLTAINGYVSMLISGDYGKISKDAHEALEKVQIATKDLSLLVGDYLDVTRIELGRMKYQFSRMSLTAITKEVIDEIRLVIKKKQLILEENIIEKDLMVNVDNNKIKQVMLNLVDNAIKYTPEGKIIISLERVGGKARFSVRDTGIGISKEVLPTLFEKFVRAPGAHSINVGGAGLGLFVGKKIMTEHKGRIWAESDGLNKGSTFSFEIDII